MNILIGGGKIKSNFVPIAISILILAAAIIVPVAAAQSSNEKIPVIIGFKGKPDAALVKAHGGDIKYQYHSIPAIAASFPEESLNGLKNNPNVVYIEEDAVVHINKKPVPIVQPSEVVPWGIERIEADKVHNAYTGAGVNVSIIDTGIDYKHPDLNVAGGESFVVYTSDYRDDNGHGTHVAGTIAALNNDIGVIGVSPEANLYALKALSRSGSGYVSDINAAIQWAIDNDMDIISMSLGSSSPSTAQKDICQVAYDAGIVIVAAAGNGYYGVPDGVDYPAAYDSVIAVAATDIENNYASFSDYGPEVELAAPGVDVYSTILGGGYDSKSGTSMATPHVSGVVALLLSTNSKDTSFDLNMNGIWDPAEVRERLNGTATDCGSIDWDEHFGHGIVNASKALEGLSSSEPIDLPIVPVWSNPEINDDYSRAGGKFVWATATVQVTNQGTSDPVPGATVTGYWIIDDETRSDVSGLTDSTGTVVFTSENIKNLLAEDISFNFVVRSATI